MGMFDWYEPAPEIRCRQCGCGELTWQGHFGPCGLMVWHEGVLGPVDQRVDEEVRLADHELARHRLPDVFLIEGWCPDGHATPALCFTNDAGEWNETHPVDGDPTEEYRRARARVNRSKGRPTT